MTTTLQELDEVLARGDIHEMHQFLRDEHEEIRAALELQAKYNELLFAVGNKYPDESRHETALRYIKQAEETQPASDAAQQKEHGDEVTSKLTGVGPLDTPVAGNYVGPPSPPNDAAPPAQGTHQ